MIDPKQLNLVLAVAMKCAHILARGISSRHERTLEATLKGCLDEVRRVEEDEQR